MEDGTSYTIAWTAIYRRNRADGRTFKFRPGDKEFAEAKRKNSFYLDESEMAHEKHRTAAKPGTYLAATEKSWSPALISAGFLAVAVFTLLGVFTPEVSLLA